MDIKRNLSKQLQHQSNYRDIAEPTLYWNEQLCPPKALESQAQEEQLSHDWQLPRCTVDHSLQACTTGRISPRVRFAEGGSSGCPQWAGRKDVELWFLGVYRGIMKQPSRVLQKLNRTPGSETPFVLCWALSHSLVGQLSSLFQSPRSTLVINFLQKLFSCSS